ncbi:MAG: hypothetical protein COC09_06355 [Gammaproteobacteria bacterium]|nr:MAG: hypothetical protein COC09_06355 [Gammaproteobacteria bacterium]
MNRSEVPKDRLDYSCAIFDEAGALCAQAAPIPAFSMKHYTRAVLACLNAIRWVLAGEIGKRL